MLVVAVAIEYPYDNGNHIDNDQASGSAGL